MENEEIRNFWNNHNQNSINDLKEYIKLLEIELEKYKRSNTIKIEYPESFFEIDETDLLD